MDYAAKTCAASSNTASHYSDTRLVSISYQRLVILDGGVNVKRF